MPVFHCIQSAISTGTHTRAHADIRVENAEFSPILDSNTQLASFRVAEAVGKLKFHNPLVKSMYALASP